VSEIVHRNALQPGYRLLWYVVERILGQGGFGITYLARDTNLDQTVAIKEYLPIELAVREGDCSVHPVSRGHEDDFHWGLERFAAEARTLARFDHPNIVRVLAVFEENNTAYMVMRYESGASLQERLPRRGTLEEGPLLAILFPVLGGLARVHAEGFIHRDIKPANLFVRDDGSPVLLDFGSARHALGRETRTLTSLVSPGYAPFEQYYSKSDRQGPWTDIYGLGATLYRAVCGVAPVDAVDRGEALLDERPDPYVPASEAAAGRYSGRLLAAIDHALAFRETDRPQDIATWRAELAVPEAPTVRSAPSARVTPAPARDADTARSVVDAEGPGEAGGNAAEGARVAGGERASTPDELLLAAFVGPHRRQRYLTRFRSFAASGRAWPLSWNWAAALLTVPWLCYRRLYGWALVGYPLALLGAALLLSVPLSALFWGGGEIPDRVAVPVLVLLAVLGPALLADGLYYRRARRLAGRAAARGHGGEAAVEWLARRGGTSRLGALGGAAAVAALVALLAAEQPASPSRGARPSATAAGPDGTPSAGRAAPRPPQDAASLAALLDAARRDIEAGRLSGPPGRNATEKLRAVLAADPGNADAGALLEEIAGRYVQRAEEALREARLGRAAKLLEQAAALRPEDPEALRLGKKAAVLRALAAAREAARREDYAVARRQLDRASALAPDSARLRRLRERIERELPR